MSRLACAIGVRASFARQNDHRFVPITCIAASSRDEGPRLIVTAADDGTERRSVSVVVSRTEFRRLLQDLGSLRLAAERACGRLRCLDPCTAGARVRLRAYQPFVSDRVVGFNRVMIGEAAAFVDPLLSLGVTASMRHAAEAAELITTSSRRRRSALRYDRRVRAMGCLYNDALERLMYEPTVRRRFGMRQAARSYVVLGYATNALYTRFRPATSQAGAAALALVLAMFRVWIRLWSWAARIESVEQRQQHRLTRATLVSNQ